MLWDIFCKVIDNHGDIGVCWRLARDLARRGQKVRLWADDLSALEWMAPGGQERVQARLWEAAAGSTQVGDVVVEAFGCELDPAFIARMASRPAPPAWINLEYLTAESFAARSHGLSSPVFAGPGAGLTKYFFYPGFTPDTGGLLREPQLAASQSAFDSAAWRAAQGVGPDRMAISLFCYEPAALDQLLAHLQAWPQPVHLMVTAGRAKLAIEALGANSRGNLTISFLPLMSQDELDELLWGCDFNLVRGEDSLVRALWAGRPFAWNIYPQHDNAHRAKLDAFMAWLQAPASLTQFHGAWNGFGHDLPTPDLPAWGACARAARARLLSQCDLASQLIDFVMVPKNR